MQGEGTQMEPIELSELKRQSWKSEKTKAPEVTGNTTKKKRAEEKKNFNKLQKVQLFI